MQLNIFVPSLFYVILGIGAQRHARQVSSLGSLSNVRVEAVDIGEASFQGIPARPVNSHSTEFRRRKRKADGHQGSIVTSFRVPRSVFKKSTETNENEMAEHQKLLKNLNSKRSELATAEEDEEEGDDEDADIHENEKRNADNLYSDEVSNEGSPHSHLKREGPEEPKVWDQWGKWSCCSASCGTGKMTRWRHCMAGGCASGQKEAQLKACQIKSCR